VLANVDAVLDVLGRLRGGPLPPDGLAAATPLELVDGSACLQRRADDLLGATRGDRSVRILVTLPSQAADDPALVRALLAAGMDCARINCAHDDEPAWARMIHTSARRTAGREGRRSSWLSRGRRSGRGLSGHKRRCTAFIPNGTGEDACGRPPSRTSSRRVRPYRGPTSRLVRSSPYRAHGSRNSGRPDPLRRCTRAPAELVVTEVGPAVARVKCDKTVYVVSGLCLVARRGHRRVEEEAFVGELAAEARAIRIRHGDMLELTRALEPGCEAVLDLRGNARFSARVGCTAPELFEQLKVGERIFFDDGCLGGVIRAVEPERLLVEIREAPWRGRDLRADMGINFPDSGLALPALTDKDVHDLAFVARNADAVALSFVIRLEDVDALQEHLQRLGAPHLGVVLKIETRRGFERLPDLLLAAMRSPCAGGMIARGDLAVECGWERLAEVWIAEAAHMPVSWATQVLERLVKEGRPSRAEITAAAMGERAECVMLNKGRHLSLAVRTLDDILRRMQHHQQKKRSMLRPLQLAGAGAGSGTLSRRPARPSIKAPPGRTR